MDIDKYLKSITISSETSIRILIYEIRERNPDAVRFTVTTNDVKSILLYVVTKKYDMLYYLYGELFLLELCKMFENVENYEECAIIIKQIKHIKDIIKNE